MIELATPIDAFGDVTYQWQSAIAPAGPWNNIPGQTNESFDPPPLNNDLYVRVVVASTADDVECALVSDYVISMSMPSTQEHWGRIKPFAKATFRKR